MTSVFLSYEREDVGAARAVAAALERAGHSVWWDRHIKGGAQYSEAIEQALQSAEAVVVLWSERSAQSAWVRDEAAAGRDSGRLVPVSLDRSPPPLGFRQYQTIDLSGARLRDGSEGWEALLDAVADLTQGGPRDPVEPAPASATRSSPRPRLTRRSVVAGLVATAAIGGVGGFLLLRDSGSPPPPPEVEALLAQAWQAWTQGTSESYDQAIGLYLRAIDRAPQHADAWGLLACLYADRAHGASAARQSALRERAREAANRALRLDPKNAYGRAALAYARPVRGNWWLMERAFLQAMRDQPGKWLIPYSLALLWTRVGRLSEAAELFAELRDNAPTPFQYLWHVTSLWGSGQIGEAERLLEEATSIYALHPVIWPLRFDMLVSSGRAGAAIALAQDAAARPSGLSDTWLNRRIAVARAMLSQDREDADAVADELLREAPESAGDAARAIQDLAMLGRLDEAFSVADAYYFSRGFAIPDERAPAGGAVNVTLDSRQTAFLFLPPLRSMRADPRFARLMNELGLTRYWREAGARPDYLQA